MVGCAVGAHRSVRPGLFGMGAMFWGKHRGPPLPDGDAGVAIRFEQGRFPIVTPESGRFRFIRA